MAYLMKLSALSVGLGVYAVTITLVYLDYDYVASNRVQIVGWAVTSITAFSLLLAWSKYGEIMHEFKVLLVLASHRRDRWTDNLRRFKYQGVASVLRKIVDTVGLLPRDEHQANRSAKQFMWRTAQFTGAMGLVLLVLLPEVRLQVTLSTIAALTLNRLVRRALADAAWMDEYGRVVMAQKEPGVAIAAILLS